MCTITHPEENVGPITGKIEIYIIMTYKTCKLLLFRFTKIVGTLKVATHRPQFRNGRVTGSNVTGVCETKILIKCKKTVRSCW